VYGAVHTNSGEQVVILDAQWRSRLNDLRNLCSADRLMCPVCRQPVWTRAGTQRRWHFAHKHLSDCPSSRELPELLQARAVLYEWLVAKFGTGAVVAIGMQSEAG
jgi:competence CoiA-like predicted nuclease